MDTTLTLEQLLDTFERYNIDIWPMQIIAYVLGIIAIFFAIKRTKYSDRIIMGVIAFMWLWTGGVFYMFFFGPVYNISYIFGLLFIVQGIIFLAGIFKPLTSFRIRGELFPP
ncbi:MAG TPA: hypothetical protein DEQ09_09415 [Bacteroidales bacterium]|nr:hypothetical protein [Bacteroidales bacterium]